MRVAAGGGRRRSVEHTFLASSGLFTMLLLLLLLAIAQPARCCHSLARPPPTSDPRTPGDPDNRIITLECCRDDAGCFSQQAIFFRHPAIRLALPPPHRTLSVDANLCMMHLATMQRLGRHACHVRCFSASSGDVVDEMVSFARSQLRVRHPSRRSARVGEDPSAPAASRAPRCPSLLQDNREQATDVLKSGLQFMATGPDAGRWAAAGGRRWAASGAEAVRHAHSSIH